MFSFDLQALIDKVEGLSAIPAGPRRVAACARPRLQLWDALAELSSAFSDPYAQQQCQAAEVLDICDTLQELLAALQRLDLESRSQWALTEYKAIALELASQRDLAARWSAEGVSDDVAHGGRVPDAIDYSTKDDGKTKVSIRNVDDLHDQYPCGWAEDGICDRGCTVGGCNVCIEREVGEAW